MKRSVVFCLASAVLLYGCTVQTSAGEHSSYVLIDAGHGGFDGGAVASDGSCEKDYNLAISSSLRDMLTVCGISVVMTRDTDTALSHTKSEDMHQRLALYEGAQTVISIHQNSFSIPRYNGTQTFYATARSDSQQLAEAIQKAVTQHLQPDNTRPVKAVKDGIFLMNNTTSTAVLVECGFLSNPEELAKLKSPDYQQLLSFAMMLGYWDYQSQK